MASSAAKILAFTLAFTFGGFSCQRAYSQEGPTSKRLDEIERRLRNLEASPSNGTLPAETADEVTKLRLELQLPEPLAQGMTGLGPAASRVYASRTPFSVGGFAEVIYSAPEKSMRTIDLSRADLFIGSRLSANLVFNSSFEFQHGGATDTAGSSAKVNYAYIDYFMNREPKVLSGLRAGNILIPFGITNLQFEPTMYPMVNRPRIEQSIVPGPWNENGALAFWTSDGWLTQVGMVNGGYMGNLSAASTSALDERTWIRGGRQAGASARASSAGYFARIESAPSGDKPGSPKPGLGISLYTGNWAQGNESEFGEARVILGEIHAGIRLGRSTLQAMHVEGYLGDTEKIFLKTTRALGKRVRGTTIIAAIDVLPTLPDSDTPVVRELPLFLSYERENLQAEREPSVPERAGMQVNTLSFGANYRPHEQLILKGDIALESTERGSTQQILESGLGVTF
jgi:hypothetical protein